MDQECQQDKCELITISCKLSEKNKKGKWFVIDILINVDFFYYDFLIIILIKSGAADYKKVTLLTLKIVGTWETRPPSKTFERVRMVLSCSRWASLFLFIKFLVELLICVAGGNERSREQVWLDFQGRRHLHSDHQEPHCWWGGDIQCKWTFSYLCLCCWLGCPKITFFWTSYRTKRNSKKVFFWDTLLLIPVFRELLKQNS